MHAFLLMPVPLVKTDIKVNGSDLPITVSPTDVISITVTLDPASDAGREALNNPLPEGDYLFIFGVDSSDARPSGPWWGLDSVSVKVQD